MARSFRFQVLSTPMVWAPTLTSRVIESPNINSPWLSPSRKILIWRVCVSSGELRTMVIGTVAEPECTGGGTALAIRNGRPKHADADDRRRRPHRADRQLRSAARCATDALDRRNGGPVR